MSVVDPSLAPITLNGEKDRQSERNGSLPRFSPSVGPQDIPTLDMSGLSASSASKSDSRVASTFKSDSLMFEAPTPVLLRNGQDVFMSPKSDKSGEDAQGASQAGEDTPSGLHHEQRGRSLEMLRPRSPVPPPSLENIFTSSPETLISSASSSLLERTEECGSSVLERTETFTGSSSLDRTESQDGESDHDFGGHFQILSTSASFSTDMSSDSEIFGASSAASSGFELSSDVKSRLPTPTLRSTSLGTLNFPPVSFGGENNQIAGSRSALPNTLVAPLSVISSARFDTPAASQADTKVHTGSALQPMSLLSASQTDTSTSEHHNVPPAPPLSHNCLSAKEVSSRFPCRFPR